MCTALSLNNKKTFLFGRNMDIEAGFGQQVVITPRNFTLPLRFNKPVKQKYATIGMAYPFPDQENGGIVYPLYAEAANEKGLAVAGLNFPGTAHYPKPGSIKKAFELTPFEIIPYLLSQFTTTKEVKKFIESKNMQLVDRAIMKQLPVAPLHFIVADKNNESIVIEPTKDGLNVHDNPLGILTNNPTFDWQITNLSFYANLKQKQSTDAKWDAQDLKPFGQGFGSFSLPGDWTPPSRFVKTAYLKSHSAEEQETDKLVTQFFHILDNVSMVKGGIIVEQMGGDGKMHEHYDITLYASCIDLNTGTYYYKSYDNNQIQMIKLSNEGKALDGKEVIVYPFSVTQAFNEVNKK